MATHIHFPCRRSILIPLFICGFICILEFTNCSKGKDTSNTTPKLTFKQAKDFNKVKMRTLTSEETKLVQKIFNTVKHEVAISDGEISEKRRIVGSVLENLRQMMSLKEPLFKKMFSEFVYTGSFFDGLRIQNANEFDINVVLTLPIRRDRIMLDTSAGPSTYALLKIDYEHGDPTVGLDYGLKGRFEANFLDKDRYLDPEKVLHWMKSVIGKTRSNQDGTYPTEDVQSVQMSESGPAKTLKIKLWNQEETIDVDLVAVFRFESKDWTEAINTSFQQDIVNLVPTAQRRMYLVPKPSECHGPLWRKHFLEVERVLLNGKVAAKPIIRILKLFRDICGWKNLASYYLKTLVMHEIMDHWSEAQYWQDEKLPQLVFKMLDKLLECFERKSLLHLLYRDQNLLEKLGSQELQNFYCRLKKIMNIINMDIEKISIFFIPPTSVSATNQVEQEIIIQEVNNDNSGSCTVL